MGTKHAFVCFALDVWDEVRPIDSDPVYLPFGEGAALLDSLRQGEELVPADADEVALWQARYDEWASTKPRSMSEEQIMSSWLYFGNPPRPTSKTAATLAEVQGWLCWKQEASTRTPLAFASIAEGVSELPLDRFAHVLDALAEEGWTIAHVSEDRAIRASESVPTAEPVRFRILMTKQ